MRTVAILWSSAVVRNWHSLGQTREKMPVFPLFWLKKRFLDYLVWLKLRNPVVFPVSGCCGTICMSQTSFGCAVRVVMVLTLGRSVCQLSWWQIDWTHRRPAAQHSEGLAEQKLPCQAKQQPAFPQNPSWQGLKDSIKHLKPTLPNMRIFQKHTMSLRNFSLGRFP